MAARRERAAVKAWADGGMPMVDPAQKFPATATSPSALALAQAAAPLGITLSTAPGAPTAASEAAKGFEGLLKFVDAELARADDTIDAPPAAVAEFMAAHAAAVETLRG